ncbi:MAG: YdeI/OmpD-associated family protein [Planctomycetota bacterium]
MPKTDPRVDDYIQKAPPFARPILEKIRKVMHKGDRNFEENIKWGNPTFELDGIVGGMGAFKKHVAWGFWNAPAMSDPEGLFEGNPKKSPYAMKVADVKEMPSEKVLVGYVKEAVALNKAGVKRPTNRVGGTKPPARAPKDLMDALKKSPKALATYKAFSPSKKRDYVEWVTEAKRDATRTKRIATAVEWMAEGKSRNWKYEKKC